MTFARRATEAPEVWLRIVLNDPAHLASSGLASEVQTARFSFREHASKHFSLLGSVEMPGNGETKPVLLKKWRFAQDQKGEAGEVKYWWSDGSKTKERVISHAQAVDQLKIIQDNSGMKPD